MSKILTSNVYAPDGAFLERGQKLPAGLPKEFRDDIAEFLVEETAHPLLQLPVGTEEELTAAWRRVHEHDPAADPLVTVAADRVRHAAIAAGHHRIGRLRPFVDELTTDDDEPPGEVTLHATSNRNREGRS